MNNVEDNNNTLSHSNEIDTHDCMLTTYDNPFNPFDDFINWFKYDVMLGHNSCQLLNETANVDFIQSEEINEKDVEDAIDYIVLTNPIIYKKVYRSDFKGDTPMKDKN